jgi:LysM repeat protein
VVTSTPKEDGSVSHEVQPGEALWSIALAYGTTVDELKQLNGLGSNDIYEGQVLLIRRKETQTAEPGTPTVTVTIGVPVSTATRRPTTTLTPTATPIPKPPATRQSGGLIAGVIVFGALLAAGVGTWLGTKRSH